MIIKQEFLEIFQKVMICRLSGNVTDEDILTERSSIHSEGLEDSGLRQKPTG